jgi:5'-3' exonuclease
MTWLFIDVPNAAHRAYFGWGLGLGGHNTAKRNAVCLYGLLRDLSSLINAYVPNRIVFAFDGEGSARRKLVSTYKSRKAYPERDWAKKNVKQQIEAMYIHQLQALGFTNLYKEEGYEADDMIARVMKDHFDLSEDDSAIIFSSDKDFYQLLDRGVFVQDPLTKQPYTVSRFTDEWGIQPNQWPLLKAVAGCTSDTIPGVKGFAEKTAARWIRGTLGKREGNSNGFQNKVELVESEEMQELIKRNLQLIKIPFGNCPRSIEPESGQIEASSWEEVIRKTGLKGLAEYDPVDIKRMRRG